MSGVASELRCVECGQPVDGRTWRVVRVDDLREEPQPKLAVHCAGCASREFGASLRG